MEKKNGIIDMMKLLDYYCLSLLRGGMLSYRATGLMSSTLTLNVFSLVILFNQSIILQYTILIISYLVIVTLVNAVFDVIYNKKRREQLKEKYKDESLKSRRSGAAWVWAYQIFSVILLIIACSTIKGPQP